MTTTNDLLETVERAIAAINGEYADGWTYDDFGPTYHEMFHRMADAAIAAIGPTVPVIPEGWHLNRVQATYDRGDDDDSVLAGYAVLLKRPRLYGGDWASGEGDTYIDALTAAIQAAKDETP